MKSLVKRPLGRVISWLRPDIVQRLEQHFESCRSPYESEVLAERLVLEWLIAKHEAAHDEESIVRSHKAFWAGERALAFHGAAARRIESHLSGRHAELFERLQEVISQGGYRRLCELGCGAGVLTNAMAERLPMLEEIIGIDLCPRQVELNRERFSNPRLTFAAADGAAWVAQHGEPGTVYLTYDGVLEYFAQPELEKMLRRIRQDAPSCFALLEPIAFDFDLEREVESRIFGRDLSLSHNYPHLFTSAGFGIRWQKELPRGRYLMMIATGEAPS